MYAIIDGGAARLHTTALFPGTPKSSIKRVVHAKFSSRPVAGHYCLYVRNHTKIQQEGTNTELHHDQLDRLPCLNRTRR